MIHRGRSSVSGVTRFGQLARSRLRGVLRAEEGVGRLQLWGRHGDERRAGVDLRRQKFAATAPEAGPSVPDDTRVQRVLDLAMRVGEVLLSSGEGVAEATETMLRLADAGGLPTCEVDITFTSITMCCHRGMVAPPVTTMRLVRYRSLDLTRLTEVSQLVDRIERGELEDRRGDGVERRDGGRAEDGLDDDRRAGDGRADGEHADTDRADDEEVEDVPRRAELEFDHQRPTGDDTGTLSRAAAELDQINRAKHPYPRWLATLAWAGMAASIAVLLGGGWVAAAVAFGATGAMDRVGRVLNKAGLPLFFQQITGALLATLITAALLYLNLLPPSTRPSFVVAAAITVLLSGLSVVSAVRDAIDGFFLTAAGRAGEIAMYSAGLLAGSVLGLKAALVVGVELAVAAPLPTSNVSLAVRAIAAGLTAGMFALAGYTPVRYLAAAAGTGAGGWVIYTLMEQANFEPVVSTLVAAIALGVSSGVLYKRFGVPRLVISLAGITPLLPGLTAYRGFYQLAVIGVADGLVTVTLALAIGLALAGGVAFGEWLTSRVTPRTHPPIMGAAGTGGQ
ncbi:MAG: threonine/serine exporter family protein [Pseudonocardia sp.]|nr:threonine/serine exporter family protein [Pseudonocardia sp.]MBO0876916.1 threonine/serine exporter family protein [Pseudonocardia sp.]